MNAVILIGRLAKDPTLRRTQSGNVACSFTLAVKKQNSDDADFINCVAWNKTAEAIEKYVSKGTQVAVRGKIQTRKYQDKDGKTVYTLDVVCDQVDFLQRPKQEDQKEQPKQEPEPYIDDGDLPF